MLAKLSERGQISIPAAARKKFGMKPKSKVSIEIGEKEIIIRPVKSIDEVYGIFQECAKDRDNDWERVRSETEAIVAREVEDESRR